LGPGLVLLGFSSEIVVAGVVEFTIMVLLSEVSLYGVGDSEEVGHMDGVADVSVKVILEVFKHVHVLVDEVISSNSWERESLVVKFPCVNLKFWVGTGLLVHGFGNSKNVSPVSGIESSGEHINLIVEFLLSLIQIFTWLLELNKGGIVIRISAFEGKEVNVLSFHLSEGIWYLSLSSGDSSQKKEGSNVFHLERKMDECYLFWFEYLPLL
jgi:hypothetical protein